MNPEHIDPLYFPPAPLDLWGTMQFGTFGLAHPLDVPHGLTALWPNRVSAGILRYLGGDLCHDLFLVASVVRHRRRVGMYVHHLLVSTAAGVHAASEKWEIPSQQGEFEYSDGNVRITDERGEIIEYSIAPRFRTAVPALLPMSTFGTHGDWLVYAPIIARGRARPADMRILNWPSHLPALSTPRAATALEATRYRMTVPQALPIGLL